MNSIQKNSKDEINKKTVDLVIARMQATISPNLRLARGFEGSLDKEEMIEHVKQGTEIGQRLIQSHLNFMRAQASGKLITTLNTVR